ncbi:hypothetical protein NSE01_24000 [Novosphingobium sediminis]|uniref:Uncharacterized protein n=1 Tax=Novosphingobium sediminis TaxID=707214 RepID=A0A512ALK4_9SPHN|nr:hypothetical protein NSE01_24000 [Novosphingobium sediminis]
MTGLLRDVATLTGDHLVCHCSDCLAFLRFCNRAQAPAVIDGVQLFLTRVSRMVITTGKSELACVHLTQKPMLRWYAQCCPTPLFHTVHSGWYPFVTTHVATLDPERRGEAIGKPRGHTFVDDVATVQRSFRTVSRNSIMARFIVGMWKDLLSGDFRRAELFEPRSLRPIVSPKRLSPSERAEIEA